MTVSKYTRVVGSTISVIDAFGLADKKELYEVTDENCDDRNDFISDIRDGLKLSNDLILFPLTHDQCPEGEELFVLGIIIDKSERDDKGLSLPELDIDKLVEAKAQVEKLWPKNITKGKIVLHSIQDDCICCS